MHDIIRSNLSNESTMFIMKINLFNCMYPCNNGKYHVTYHYQIRPGFLFKLVYYNNIFGCKLMVVFIKENCKEIENRNQRNVIFFVSYVICFDTNHDMTKVL